MRGLRSGKVFCAISAALLCALAVLIPVPAAAFKDTYSAESQHLLHIEAVSRNFKNRLERIIFSSTFVQVAHREALEKMTIWIRDNKYGRLPEFLDALDQEDVETVFSAFQSGRAISSEETIPLIEAPESSGQYTVVSFPFTGEFFVAQGNGGWVSHKKDTGNEFSWDFVIRKNGGMIFGNGGKNENYYAWGKPVLAPADGVVRRIRNDQKDHPPMTTELNKSNFVKIDHLNGEFSNIHHLQEGSITVKEGDRVKRGQEIGRIGDSGISMFPHIHFQLDRGRNVDDAKAAPSVFSCYFARHKDELNWRLVVSGAPRDGDYLLSAGDYLDKYYNE